MTDLEFEKARYNGILEVMKKDRKQYFELQKKYDRLLSEHNLLKITHMKFLEESSERRIKDAEKVIKLKQKHKKEYNKLLEREQNKGWNDL